MQSTSDNGLEKGSCEKEFEALKKCFRKVCSEETLLLLMFMSILSSNSYCALSIFFFSDSWIYWTTIMARTVSLL
jgi:hypothetical protein